MAKFVQFLEKAASTLIILGFSSTLAAQSVNEQATVVDQLRAILDQTDTLSAAVEQLLIDQDGRELQESRHRLVMRKPSYFYWEDIEPFEALMVTNGELIWRYEPDLDQVTIEPFDTEIDRTPIMLLNGDVDSIGSAYDVSVARSEGQQMQYFTLLPRNPDRLFERLTVTFNGVVLEQMQFEDSLGQQTSLTFSEVQRNHSIEQGLFTFTPPPGVEIIDNSGD